MALVLKTLVNYDTSSYLAGTRLTQIKRSTINSNLTLCPISSGDPTELYTRLDSVFSLSLCLISFL